jgi:hypothetical protein
MLDKVAELIRGAYDLHVHAGPDIVPRRQDIIDVARDARDAGMGGLVFKDHWTTTADRASIASKVVPGVNLFGGIVLNHAVGGLNPEAVDKAIKLGARIIWMPSVDAAYTVKKVVITNETPWLKPFVSLNRVEDAISVLKGGLDGSELVPEVREILKLISDADVILDTCHLCANEAFPVVKEAKRMGISKIIVTHPNCSVNKMTISEQRGFAELGTFLSYAFLPCMPMYDRQDLREVVEMIKTVGAEHCLLFTDFGQILNPPEVEGLKLFIVNLLASGISEDEIKIMVKHNPETLLNLF